HSVCPGGPAVALRVSIRTAAVGSLHRLSAGRPADRVVYAWSEHVWREFRELLRVAMELRNSAAVRTVGAGRSGIRGQQGYAAEPARKSQHTGTAVCERCDTDDGESAPEAVAALRRPRWNSSDVGQLV